MFQANNCTPRNLGPFLDKACWSRTFLSLARTKTKFCFGTDWTVFSVPRHCCVFCVVFVIPIYIKYSSSLQKATWKNLGESRQIEIHLKENERWKCCREFRPLRTKYLRQKSYWAYGTFKKERQCLSCYSHLSAKTLLWEITEDFLSRLQIIQTILCNLRDELNGSSNCWVSENQANFA